MNRRDPVNKGKTQTKLAVQMQGTLDALLEDVQVEQIEGLSPVLVVCQMAQGWNSFMEAMLAVCVTDAQGMSNADAAKVAVAEEVMSKLTAMLGGERSSQAGIALAALAASMVSHASLQRQTTRVLEALSQWFDTSDGGTKQHSWGAPLSLGMLAQALGELDSNTARSLTEKLIASNPSVNAHAARAAGLTLAISRMLPCDVLETAVQQLLESPD